MAPASRRTWQPNGYFLLITTPSRIDGRTRLKPFSLAYSEKTKSVTYGGHRLRLTTIEEVITTINQDLAIS